MSQHPLRELAEMIERVAREHPCGGQVWCEVRVLCDHIALRARVEELREMERDFCSVRKVP